MRRRGDRRPITRLLVAAIVLGLAAHPFRGASAEPRSPFSTELMEHPEISEASPLSWVELRNQPYRIYERFADKKSKYAECRSRYEPVKHRYFRIRYKSFDGLFVEGVVVVPKEFQPTMKYPVMIFNHGNFQEGGRFTFCDTRRYDTWTDKGFIVFGPQYRGVSGGEGIDEWGGKDVLDVLKIIEIARGLPFVDSRNVFMSGNSRGGLMVYLALKHGAQVNAAIVNCGVADAIETSKRDDVVAEVISDSLSEAEKRAEYVDRSAVFWPDKIRTPLLILHGELDAGVPPGGARKIAKLLEERRVAHKLVVYPEGGHCEGYPDAYKEEMYSWVTKYMAQ